MQLNDPTTKRTGKPAALVIVMGVSGCGKSTVGRSIADRLQVEFLEGDLLHPPRNVERMAAGIALTDDDRRGWLESIAERLRQSDIAGLGLVVSCSALKRSYRDLLRSGAATAAFVYLAVDADVLTERLRRRADHFMPASLLASQLATLEPPAADERAARFDATGSSATLTDAAVAWIDRMPGESAPR